MSIVRGKIGEGFESASDETVDVSLQVMQGVKCMLRNNSFH